MYIFIYNITNKTHGSLKFSKLFFQKKKCFKQGVNKLNLFIISLVIRERNLTLTGKITSQLDHECHHGEAET